MRRVFLTFLFACLQPSALWAGEVTIAVASNFALTAEKLADAFEDAGEHQVVLSQGSTGQLFAQIRNGAPFDIFLAADQRRPAELGERTLEQRTFALGRLVLVSRRYVDIENPAEDFAGMRVALADPMVAPYGLAALVTMERMRLDTATFQPVLLSNVGQVAAVFQTGNADIAFVPASLVDLMDPPNFVPLDKLQPEIRQDGVLLARAEDNEAARAFWDFLFSDTGRAIIEADGYGVAE